MPYAVEMIDIIKDFPGIRANDGVTLRVERGSIHALLGENGAGKSTLMSILFGLYKADSGRILVNGKETPIRDPNDANALGIGMVHQHFKLVHCFTVAENIVLGREPRKARALLDMKSAVAKVRELSALYGLDVDPDARIEDISVGMQQRVEILKMLYRDADILIFDEPTAVLTPQEIAELTEIMRKLSAQGKTIILITHKLKEIKAVAGTCTVLRRGKLVGSVEVEGTSEESLAEMMVGRQVSFHVDKGPAAPGREVLRLEDLCVRNARGLPAVRSLSLSVRSGEIMGLCGIDGNGQTELVQAIVGLTRADAGRILLGGADISRAPIRKRFDSGLGHIPEDRQRYGLVLDFSLEENFVIHDFDRPPYARAGIMDARAIRRKAEALIGEFDVRSGGGAAGSARSLSGGNQQKAIVAREIDRSPGAFIVSQPTRGLDVGAIEYIHRRIVAERDKGKAVLLVSFELDEIMDLSDRIAVMHSGEIVGIVDPKLTSEQELGLMMSGSLRKAG